MNTYTIVFKCSGGVAGQPFPNQTVKADTYTFNASEGFVHFYVNESEESIASFSSGDIMSVIKTA